MKDSFRSFDIYRLAKSTLFLYTKNHLCEDRAISRVGIAKATQYWAKLNVKEIKLCLCDMTLLYIYMLMCHP